MAAYHMFPLVGPMTYTNRSKELKCVPGHCHCATAIRGQSHLSSWLRAYQQASMSTSCLPHLSAAVEVVDIKAITLSRQYHR
jgi:hypothetical protein